MRNEQDQRVAENRDKIENKKGATMSPKIDQYSAGIGVERAEQRAQRIVTTDNENARAKRLQIFRHETHPQLFARADDKNGDEQNDEIAFEPEKLRELAPGV